MSQGSNLPYYSYDAGVVLVRGAVCELASMSWDYYNALTCTVDFDTAMAGDLVVVVRGEGAAWWDIVNDTPVPVDSASWCPEPCPVETGVTDVLCSTQSWPPSAETCLASTDYMDINIEVRRGQGAQN